MKPYYRSATEVRKNFSECIDRAVHDRPQFVNRTRDGVVVIGERFFDDLLASAVIHCTITKDEDGTAFVTNGELSDLIGSGETEAAAIRDLATQLVEYAAEYYENYALYSRSPNRKRHLPYVLRILTLGEPDAVREILVCQSGKS